jgi:prophage regulatory protein
MNSTSPNSFVRLPQVLKETGLARDALSQGPERDLPKQSRIATRCVGWRRSALDQWLQNPMFYPVDDFT